MLEIIDPDSGFYGLEDVDFSNCKKTVVIRGNVFTIEQEGKIIFGDNVIPSNKLLKLPLIETNGLVFCNNVLMDASKVDGILYLPDFCIGITDGVINSNIKGIIFSYSEKIVYLG